MYCYTTKAPLNYKIPQCVNVNVCVFLNCHSLSVLAMWVKLTKLSLHIDTRAAESMSFAYRDLETCPHVQLSEPEMSDLWVTVTWEEQSKTRRKCEWRGRVVGRKMQCKRKKKDIVRRGREGGTTHGEGRELCEEHDLKRSERSRAERSYFT